MLGHSIGRQSKEEWTARRPVKCEIVKLVSQYLPPMSDGFDLSRDLVPVIQSHGVIDDSYRIDLVAAKTKPLDEQFHLFLRGGPQFSNFSPR